jgi:hypothetical protein
MGTESELKWLFEGFMVKRMELLLKDIKTKKETSMAARFKPAQPQARARYHCDCFDEQCQGQTCH